MPLIFFFFRGYAKDQIFRPKVGGVAERRARTNNAGASVIPQVL
jgi:hypothetical protein